MIQAVAIPVVAEQAASLIAAKDQGQAVVLPYLHSSSRC
jgi:hypothetical protein